MNSTGEFHNASDSAIEWRPGRLWSLWDMLRLYANAFYAVMASLNASRMTIQSVERAGKGSEFGVSSLDEVTARVFSRQLGELQEHLKILGAQVTEMAVDSLIDDLSIPPLAESLAITFGTVAQRFGEIDSRLRDELSLATVFVLEKEKAKYFDPKEPLFGKDFEVKFSSALFEVDEAAKCMTLGRDTAGVFHLMRCMEIGIRSVATSLGIPDPAKGTNRNWNEILKKIKSAMDAKLNPPTWKPGDRDFFESSYGSLDATRVAWRNPTMHIENKYTQDEAEHIFIAVRGFMKNLASRMDEQGWPLA